MAPGTWKAIGENDALASASRVAYCGRSQTVLTRLNSADAPHRPAVCTSEQGE